MVTLAYLIIVVTLSLWVSPAAALTAYRGTTPILDGRIDPTEWADADHLSGIQSWNAEFSKVQAPSPGEPVDLDVAVWVKHDGNRLYFAIRVLDDLLYRYQEAPWVPVGNPNVNALNQSGWPWFGDEVELLLNANHSWSSPNQTVTGDAHSWQMVCNLAKSRLGGLGVGGLLEGEPRSSRSAWNTYRAWILTGAQQAVTRASFGAAPFGGSLYEIEWSIAFNPCVNISGVVWSPSSGRTTVGLNIALGDVDTQAEGDAYFGIRHENWLSGRYCGSPGRHPNCHTFLSQFAALVLDPNPKAPP